jgi:hypothetical protein
VKGVSPTEALNLFHKSQGPGAVVLAVKVEEPDAG